MPQSPTGTILDYIFKFFEAIFNFYRNADFIGGSLLWFVIAVGITGAVISYIVKVANTR